MYKRRTQNITAETKNQWWDSKANAIRNRQATLYEANGTKKIKHDKNINDLQWRRRKLSTKRCRRKQRTETKDRNHKHSPTERK